MKRLGLMGGIITNERKDGRTDAQTHKGK